VILALVLALLLATVLILGAEALRRAFRRPARIKDGHRRQYLPGSGRHVSRAH
jgi:hypothetical protein